MIFAEATCLLLGRLAGFAAFCGCFNAAGSLPVLLLPWLAIDFLAFAFSHGKSRLLLVKFSSRT